MSDLAETIAWWRDQLKDEADDALLRFVLEPRQVRVLLDAAEAGMRARDAALEEAAQIVDSMVHPDNKASPAYAVCLGAGRRIRALKGAA